MKKTSSAIMVAGIASSMLLGAPMFAADKAAAPAAPAATKATPAAKAAKPVDNWAFLPEVVAEIDGKKITKVEVVALINEQLPANAGAMLTPELCKKLAPGVVNSIVDQEVRLKLAAAKGFLPSEQLAGEAFDDWMKSIPQDKIGVFEKQLAAQNKTIKSYRAEVVGDKNAQKIAAIRTWIRKDIEPSVKIADADIAKFYAENKSKFEVPPMIKASHILIKPKDDSEAAKKEAKAEAEKLLADIKAGKITFEKAAEEKSACPSGKQKGSLGEFPRGEMDADFDNAAFALKVGELSGVVQTQFGYHIIRKDGEKPGKSFGLGDKPEGQTITIKEIIEKYLHNQKVQKAINDQLATAKKTFKVQVFVKEEAPVAKAAPAPKAK